MYGTVLQITMTPQELTELLDQRLAKALAGYTPPPALGSDLPELLTRRQAANALQISLTTLHEWAKDTADRAAVLVPLKLNGRVRYRRADVLNTLQESRRFKVAKG